jgi:hypothetical protein
MFLIEQYYLVDYYMTTIQLDDVAMKINHLMNTYIYI